MDIRNIYNTEAYNDHQKLLRHNKALKQYIGDVTAVLEGLEDEDLLTASSIWFDLPLEIQEALWIAESNGGLFSRKQRQILQSTHFKQLYFGDNNEHK